jgi:TonB family protein
MIGSISNAEVSCTVPVLKNSEMTFRLRAVRCFFAAVCINSCLSAASAVAQSKAAAAGSIAFNIPAQPLDQALDAFGAATGLQIFYENSLTDGRRSTAVEGVFEPRPALRMLLSGSGLTGRVIAPNTISIAGADDMEAAQAKRQAELTYRPYYGFLQQGVMKALCGREETRPGNYHVAIQYWIDPAGRIERFRLIGSSGNAERDAAVLEAMRGIVLPPPGDLPQPVTMSIEPVGASGCGPRDAEAARVP